MSYEKETGIAGIKAIELTVKDQRALLLSTADRAQAMADDPAAYDAYAEQMFEDITLHEIVTMSTASMADLEDLRESELRKVADACIKVNPFFFAMRDRERARNQKLMDQNPDLFKRFLEKKLKQSETASES